MSAALLDHIWQSTLFAGCAWLVTLLLRNNGAHLRYGVWLAASIKFLVPLSLLVMLGEQFQPLVSSEGGGALPGFDANGVTALLAAPGRTISAESPGTFWLGVAGSVWLPGFLALALRWLIRWRRIRLMLSAAAAAAGAGSVPVMTSPSLREPAVVGIFRPVLLLPAGIRGLSDHLTTSGRPQARALPLAPPRQPDRLDPHARRGAVLVPPAGVVDRRAAHGGARARLRRNGGAFG